jgi:hypothetical protein
MQPHGAPPLNTSTYPAVHVLLLEYIYCMPRPRSPDFFSLLQIPPCIVHSPEKCTRAEVAKRPCGAGLPSVFRDRSPDPGHPPLTTTRGHTSLSRCPSHCWASGERARPLSLPACAGGLDWASVQPPASRMVVMPLRTAQKWEAPSVKASYAHGLAGTWEGGTARTRHTPSPGRPRPLSRFAQTSSSIQ